MTTAYLPWERTRGALTYQVDHCADGLERLLQQFKDRPRIAALLCAFVRQVQELEDAAWQLLTERHVDAAIGVQLDALGRIVGMETLAAAKAGMLGKQSQLSHGISAGSDPGILPERALL